MAVSQGRGRRGTSAPRGNGSNGDEAITHGEQAYRTAKRSTDSGTLQPYAQNYINVLRQFGEEGQAARILAQESSLGVH